ncbi:Small RNA 2'-O-methyltransferase [Mortierella sp. GBA35]|nr:Small RNA 2'-O-methyltransferase [Mortierella sp. GBA35]
MVRIEHCLYPHNIFARLSTVQQDKILAWIDNPAVELQRTHQENLALSDKYGKDTTTTVQQRYIQGKFVTCESTARILLEIAATPTRFGQVVGRWINGLDEESREYLQDHHTFYLSRLGAFANVRENDKRWIYTMAVDTLIQLSTNYSDSSTPDSACDTSNEPRFFPPLWQQRRNIARRILEENNVTSVIDFGCGEGALLSLLIWETTGDYPITRLAGVELREERLQLAAEACQPQDFELESNLRVNPLTIDLFQGSADQPDARLIGFDALVCLEVYAPLLNIASSLLLMHGLSSLVKV